MQRRALRQGEVQDEFDTEVRELWVRDRVAKGELNIIKVKGDNNVADVPTKHVERSKMGERMGSCGFVRRSGRHELLSATRIRMSRKRDVWKCCLVEFMC